MERIGNILANLDRGTATLSRGMTMYEEPDPTEEELKEELRKSLGVSTLENTFENFLPQKGTEKALKACRLLAGGKTRWNMLMLYGGVGNGKSHLLEALSIYLHKKGIFCRVMTYPKMMGFLKSTMDKNSTTRFDDVLGGWCQAPRLIIDDVGIGGSDTEWSMKMLEEIILARYKDNMFTVLSTNVDTSELPERVISRFKDPEKARMIQNRGEDYRPGKR